MDYNLMQREEKVKELDVLLKVFNTLSLHHVIRDKSESAIHKLMNELYNFKDIKLDEE